MEYALKIYVYEQNSCIMSSSECKQKLTELTELHNICVVLVYSWRCFKVLWFIRSEHLSMIVQRHVKMSLKYP